MSRERPTVREWGEDRLVAELTRGLPRSQREVHGAGDDCAAFLCEDQGRMTLLKTDVVVEGVHFLPTTPAAAVGWKAAARAVSDIAAMGGEPHTALVTVVVPPSCEVAWLTGLYEGLTAVAREYGFGICGGETSSAPEGSPAVVSVMVTGTVLTRHCIPRSGGRPGDVIFVTGCLGGSLAGWHLHFRPRVAEARWLTRNFSLRAMMDLSDGLGKDLPRLAGASGTGWELELDAIPRRRGCSLEQALHDGEDFELLFAVPPESAAGLAAAWPEVFPELPLTRIGRLAEPGRQLPALAGGGFDHFARP